jgi:hypothetical protein
MWATVVYPALARVIEGDDNAPEALAAFLPKWSAGHKRAKDALAASSVEMGAAPSTADIPTGTPGRPTSMHLIDAELTERADRGETLPTLSAEANALLEWLIGKHPKASRPTPKTIKNNLRHKYNGLKKGPK